MNAGTFEPRERSPFRFGILIALLGCLDPFAVNLAKVFVVKWAWVSTLGSVTLPLLWVLVSAVARGADDHSQTWPAFAQLGV
jgi:hypothetical protein